MEKRKNVLLITYYWPPSGGAGVHRWLRFSKYFTENNCNLTVYCPEDAAWPAIDPALLKEVPDDIKVIRRKIFEPHKYLGKGGGTGVGFTQEKKQGVVKKLIIWTRGNLFIPDSRKFWIKPSTRYLTKYLNEHPEIDTIITTGPPHSLHLIGKALKEKLKLRWIADFRDPWTQIDFYEQLLPGEAADKKHKDLEKACLEGADEVITVSDACASGLEEISKRNIHVVTNGYEFPDFDTATIDLDREFTISHFGSMPFARNPLVLWKALKALLVEQPELSEKLKIKLIGSVDFNVLQSANEHGLKNYIEVIPPVPHAESIELQRKTQLLLLVANNTGNVKGILTGKFFEYLGTKRPIIAIGLGESDLEKAVDDTKCGYFAHYEDESGMKNYLHLTFEKFNKSELIGEAINLDQFHSRTLAKKIIDLL